MFTNFDFCNWLNRFTLYFHLLTVVMCAVICIISTFFTLLTYSSTSLSIPQIFFVIALSMHPYCMRPVFYEWPYFFMFCLNHTDNKRCEWRHKRLVFSLVNFDFNAVNLVFLSVELQRCDYICRLQLTVFCIQRLGFRFPDFRSI